LLPGTGLHIIRPAYGPTIGVAAPARRVGHGRRQSLNPHGVPRGGAGGRTLMGDMQLKAWTIGVAVFGFVLTLAIVGLMFS